MTYEIKTTHLTALYSDNPCELLLEQEGQHPLTGQCAPPISGGRDL